MDDPNLYVYVGGAIHFLFFIGYKFLRRKKILLVAFAISLVLVSLAIYYRDLESLQSKNGSHTSWFYSPFLFLVYFTICRAIYKAIYKYEPVLSKLNIGYWGREEKRLVHFADFVFTILIALLPFLTLPLLR